MVDTGAERTCVADSVCKKLGLTPLRFTPVVGVSGKPEDRPLYLMAIGIGMSPNPGEAGADAQTVWYHSEVIGVPDAKAQVEYKGLLGRDFLAAFRLTYDGPTATYEIIDRRDELRKVAPESPVAENPNPSIKPHGGQKTQKAKTRRKNQRAARRKNRN